jgi:hypothetical protein
VISTVPGLIGQLGPHAVVACLAIAASFTVLALLIPFMADWFDDRKP